jgi:chromosomal replication initiator protein
MADTTLQACWLSFLNHLDAELGKATVDRWIRTLGVRFEEGPKMILSAKDSFQALWFEEHLRPRLEHFKDPLGTKVAVSLEIFGKTKKPVQKNFLNPRTDKRGSNILTFPEGDPSLSFDKYIPVDENIIVVKLLNETCSYWIAKHLKKLSPIVIPNDSTVHMVPPNPILLCGPSGCGKTHLLTATAERLKQVGMNVIMATADTFTEHVVKSMRAGEMTAFRTLWRKADVLIIEDIQNFSRKSATQEEFFHTFNTLQMVGKQVILSANCFPQQLQYVEQRLISRFEWGIVLPLSTLPKKQYPLLIEKKALSLNFPLSSKVALFLAETFPSSPKAISQALQSLVSRLSASNGRLHPSAQHLSLSQIQDLLSDLVEKESSLALSADKIIDITAQSYGITKDDLIGKSQSRECSLPRQVAMFLMRKHLKAPYMKIADCFNKNHSTVMSATKQIERLIGDSSSDVGSSIASIEVRLYSLQSKA